MTVCMCILQSNQGLVCFRALLVTFQGSYGPISVVTVDCSLVVLIFKVSYNLVMIPMLYDGLDSK